MRLVKFLANAGVASRRASEQLIRAGRVTVDGVAGHRPGSRRRPTADAVAFDGEPVHVGVDRAVYAVNKPAGVVSTASDPQRPARPWSRSFPRRCGCTRSGRLDVDATGLILLTNDGELAHRLTHPSYEVDKTYRVVVARPPIGQRALQALRGGVTLEDGLTAPARVRRLAPDTIELTIHEGRNRQIKRMCDHVGHRVQRLTRIAFGPLTLGSLATGAHRRLTAAEVAALSESGGRRTGPAASLIGSQPPVRAAHGPQSATIFLACQRTRTPPNRRSAWRRFRLTGAATRPRARRAPGSTPRTRGRSPHARTSDRTRGVGAWAASSAWRPARAPAASRSSSSCWPRLAIVGHGRGRPVGAGARAAAETFPNWEAGPLHAIAIRLITNPTTLGRGLQRACWWR